MLCGAPLLLFGKVEASPGIQIKIERISMEIIVADKRRNFESVAYGLSFSFLSVFVFIAKEQTDSPIVIEKVADFWTKV